jgi:uncharacterized spore protein YtfJ
MATNAHHETDATGLHRRGNFIERLAEKLGITASVKAVFADPVERGNVTVIPVAKVRYGFGGGSGSKGSSEAGGGGGGGVYAAPVGYIELKDGQSQFKPIRDPASLALMIVAGGLMSWLALRGLYRLTRR